MVPTRFNIAVMLFSACFIAYMLRVNMSINLIAMVKPPKTSSGNTSKPECRIVSHSNEDNSADAKDQSTIPDYGERFDWDSRLQGLILGSYFWGSTITCIPGGILAERFGPTRTVTISTLIAGTLTLLGPVVASWHYVALIVTRFLIGLCGGVIYPCLHCLVARWAPPEEKGKFVGALLGGTLGTVVTWPLLSSIIEAWGWSYSFFINGGIVLAWCILWIFLVADRPEEHSRISDEERKYILQSLSGIIKHKNLPPYWKIFTSIPFWGLAVLHFGNLWGLFFLMTGGPNFLSSVLGFNLGHTGFLASLPYLARLIFGNIFGLIGDYIRKRQIVSTNLVRKGFVLFSHIIPGMLLLILNATGCDVTWSVALLTLSLGFNGASTLTNLQNSQDLSPNFAGSLYGIINCLGGTTGFITPLIVGHLTSERNGLAEWHIIFCIGAAVYILCGLVFCVFGTAEMQVWNEIKEVDSENGEKKGVENVAYDNSSEVTVNVADVDNTKI